MNIITQPWRFVALTAICLHASGLLRPAAAFASESPFGVSRPGVRRVGSSVKPERETKRHATTVEFKGESSTSIDVPLPTASTTNLNKSLPDWMLSAESDPFFLGTKDFRQRNDGNWDSFQPAVDWFGLELVPVFVIKLKRSASDQQVSALITEARSDISSGVDSKRGRLVSGVMGKSTFQGGNTVSWSENEQGDGWTLKADLSLTLSIPIPRFLPVPPGFNSIGSRIVRSTCKRRLEKFATNLQEAYIDWAEM